MSVATPNEGLRSIKTRKALYDATFSLLKKSSFKKITIKEICEEALISRAAFYAHFIDKYDLLQHWLNELWIKIFNNADSYEQIEKVMNYYIKENTIILKNLIYDADNETFEILFNSIISIIDISIEKDDSSEYFSKNIVLANFFAGGIISYFLWQAKHNFPDSVLPMNEHFYKIIHELRNWKLK